VTFSASIPLKAGATLALGMVLQADDGTPISVSAATIACALRDGLGNPLGNLAIALTAGAGAFVASMTPAQTAQLPSGEVFGDVLIELPTGSFYSDTFSLAVSAPIAQPPGGN
jgi:hypothetical protein